MTFKAEPPEKSEQPLGPVGSQEKTDGKNPASEQNVLHETRKDKMLSLILRWC